MYEFLCEDCNRVFNFLARTPDAAKRKPACPKCGGRRMSKLFSQFATARKRGESTKRAEASATDAPGDLSPAEEARMERGMMELARDMESVDENNPRQLAAAMRRLSDVSGEDMGPEMNEMIGRLEAGEDPEKVEDAMADALGEEGLEGGAGGAPSHDDGLYDL
jgi:putative FmdB family regulatory protein